jgi:hypothetical protein
MMNTSRLTNRCLSFPAVTVFSLLAFGAELKAAQPPSNNPKIGTRIVNFFKDVVYGERPGNRYEGYGPQQSPEQPRYVPAGNGYSLDQPPSEQSPRYSAPKAPKPAATTTKPKTPAKTPTLDSEKPEPKVEPAPKKKEPVEDQPPAVNKPEPKQEPATTPQVAKNDPPATPEPPKQSFMGPGTNATTPSPPPTPPSPPANTSSAPLTGSKTATAGRVKSPYPPFNELDVTGLPAGSLAMDPTTQKVFRVP